MKRSLSLFIFLFVAGITLSFGQDKYTISGSGSGANEVPPNMSPGTATITGTYDVPSKMLTLDINFNNLNSPITAAHIHMGAPGMNGPVVIGLTPPPGMVTSGQMGGTFPLPAANEPDLLAGNLYLNIHSQMQPGGELRGQLIASQLVPTMGQWAVICLFLTLLIFGAVTLQQRSLAPSYVKKNV